MPNIREEHVEEPRLPSTDEVRDAWVTGNQLPHYEIGNPADAKTTDELEEEFNEWYESVQAKAWLEGQSFRARVNPYKKERDVQ